jgi:pseudaminic acid cytidylyltransferase
VLPARSGSKRIPGKNIRPFCGEPMISWPIKALRDSGLFDATYVSTDDVAISELADKLGAKSIVRPHHLADDFTDTTSVIKSVIHQVLDAEGDPWVYKIYPTSPLRPEIIADFVMFAESTYSGFSVSVTPSHVPIQRALELSDQGVLSFREPLNAMTRTQDLQTFFFDAGKLYAGRKSDWLEAATPLLGSAKGFLLPDWLSVDMDTVEDWELAEFKFRREFGEK